MYIVLLISQKDYEPILFLNKFLVVACVGWIRPVKCFERFASRGIILGNGTSTHSTTLRTGLTWLDSRGIVKHTFH